MKLKCSFILKSSIALILTALMIFGSVSTVLAATVDMADVGTNDPTVFGYRGALNSWGYTAFTRYRDTQLGYYTASGKSEKSGQASGFKISNGNSWDNDKVYSMNNYTLGNGYDNKSQIYTNNNNMTDSKTGTHYICFVNDNESKKYTWYTTTIPTSDQSTIYIRNTANATNIRLYIYDPQLYDWGNSPYILKNGVIQTGGTNGWTVTELTESDGTKVYKVAGVYNAKIIIRYGDNQTADNITVTNGAAYDTNKDNVNKTTGYTEPKTPLTAPQITIGGQSSSVTTYAGETTAVKVTNWSAADYAGSATWCTVKLYKKNGTTALATFSNSDTVNYTFSETGTYVVKCEPTTAGAATHSASTSNEVTVTVSKRTLSAPTNVNFSPATVTASPSGKSTLSWTAVSGAGSYKIYKGTSTTALATVMGTSYDVDAKYSNAGDYYVVAVPSNTTTHSESDKSTKATLTVNKQTVDQPTITIDKTDIASGGTATITVTNASSFDSSKYTLKLYKTNVAQNNTFTNGATTVSAAGTYKVKAVSKDSEYYADSADSATVTLTVSTPAWYLLGISGDW